MLIDRTEKTGTAIIAVSELDGNNQIVIVPGACNNFTKDEVMSLRDQLHNSDYLLLQFEVNQEANECIVELARESNCKVILNPAPFVNVPKDFYKGIFLVTPNEHEASLLSGVRVSDIESARKASETIRKMGVENVIITLGEKGAWVHTAQFQELIPAFKVKAVDTTGAGDAFNGGLLVALAEGKDFRQAVYFANALAALSVLKIGTTPSMPYRQEIDDFLKNQN